MSASSFETPLARLLRMRERPQTHRGQPFDCPRSNSRCHCRLKMSLFDLRGVQGLAGDFGVTFPEMKRDFIESTLLPRFGLRKPERFTLGIM
jgi:hypothetical protein